MDGTMSRQVILSSVTFNYKFLQGSDGIVTLSTIVGIEVFYLEINGTLKKGLRRRQTAECGGGPRDMHRRRGD